jgi:hypothetical protein
MPISNEQFYEMYQRAGNDERKKAALDEYARRYNIDVSQMTVPQTEEPAVPSVQPQQGKYAMAADEPGILDYIMGTMELGGQIGTGAIVEPVAGMAGLAKTITSGPEEAKKTVEEIKQAGTYQPRTEGYKHVAAGVGTALKPVLETGKAIVEPVREYAGQVGGAVGQFTGKMMDEKYGEEIGRTTGEATGRTAVDIMVGAIPEILGLKGTMAAKKAAMQKVAEKVDINQMYDELGNILPEIQRELSKANIAQKEFEQLIREIPGRQMERPVKEIVQASLSPRKESLAADIAREAKPNKEILEAATEFNLGADLLPSHYADDYTYRALEQGLKSIKTSHLNAQEKSLIGKLGKEADKLIKEFGAVSDKAELSDVFRTDSQNLVTKLEGEAKKLYDKVNKAVPNKTPIDADNTLNLLNKIADDLGGIEYLSKKQKEMLQVLDPKTKPTYSRLDKYRQIVGDSLNNKNDLFKDAKVADVKRLYGAMAKDQQAVATLHGIGDLYKTARKSVAIRKGIEKQLQTVIGKDLMGSVSAKAGLAMRGLQDGKTTQFDKLLMSIPKQLGPEMRKSVVATALNDAMVQGSRKEKFLNVPGFDDFMNGLKKHKAAKTRLQKEIGDDAMKRFETFHKIVGGVRRAQMEEISTGLIVSVPKMFDEVEGIAQKLYGTVEKVGQTFGGIRPPGFLENLVTPKTARSVTADEFLASPRFKQILDNVATGKINTAKKIKRADQIVKNLKSYQKWKETLPKKDLKDLAAIGPIGYLTNKALTREETE